MSECEKFVCCGLFQILAKTEPVVEPVYESSSKKPFSKEDDDFIRENIGKMNYRGLAEKLGRTRNSISGRVNRLGLSVPNNNNPFRVVKPSQAAKKILSKKFFIKSSPPKPIKIPEPEVVVSTEYNCTLIDLESRSCRWPIGDPKTPEFRYCGIKEAEFPIYPYCKQHSKISYVR